MSGDFLSPQGPRTPHGYGSHTAVAIIAALTLLCILTLLGVIP